MQRFWLAAIVTQSLIAFAICFVGMKVHAAEPVEAGIEAGQELYDSFGCYQCHGHQGQGGSAGPRLAPDPLPYEGFAVFVRTPVARMPPYNNQVLADEQLKQIHLYLSSLESGPPASEVPMLDLGIKPISE